jgi:hypothetical protein
MFYRILFAGILANVSLAFADSFVFTSSYPVIGPPQDYQLFEVDLSLPTTSDPNYSFRMVTNYGAPIPGSPDVVPLALFNGTYYPMSDLLFSWNGGDYGLVLSPHDGYTPGDLYQASGFQTSGEVLPFFSPRPSEPVLIDPGGSLIGSGILNGALTGNEATGLYTLTETFTAPPGFLLNGDFDLIASSFICANGLITGSGNDGPVVPEASTLSGVIAGLVLCYGFLRFRSRTARSTLSTPDSLEGHQGV